MHEPNRRQFVSYAGAAIGSGAIAGCTSTQDSATNGNNDDTTGSGSYSVEMAPMGTVEFDAVPQSVYTGLPYLADMAIAAGHGDAINSVYYPEYHGKLMGRFYDRLDGISFEWDGLTDSWGAGTESLYELDSDLHLTDPAYAGTLEQFDDGDVEDIGNTVGPWFGNYYSNRKIEPPEGWREEYQYYSLWEIFGKVAAVFDENEKYDALAQVHQSMAQTIADELPAETERPSVGLVFPGEDDTLWAYKLNAPGFLTAHTRPLGAPDAFADLSFEGPSVQIDYEQLIEADPDVLLTLFTLSPSYSIADVRSSLESDPLASRVSAVEDDRVYAQGARYHGPLMHLFQLEMTAKELYPDRFWTWPGYTDGEAYPEIPDDETLFDRQEVADIVTGRA